MKEIADDVIQAVERAKRASEPGWPINFYWLLLQLSVVLIDGVSEAN